jgi:hypothetical protein
VSKQDKEYDSVISKMLSRVSDFQGEMDRLETGIRVPKTTRGLYRAHTEPEISWSITYAESLQVYACLSLMMGILVSEDKNDFISELDTSSGLESLPMLPKLYEDLTQLMYKEQRRILEDEDN